MRILIGSAGRRVYLVRWFLESMQRAGIVGEVRVTDNDPNAAAVAAASAFFCLPRYDDDRYGPALLQAVDDYEPDLFFSLNDYELDLLAGPLGDEIRGRGTRVLSLDAREQALVADKYAMYDALSSAGIRTPTTVLASDAGGVAGLRERHSHFVVKDRYGSGSSGLTTSTGARLTEVLERLRESGGERRLEETVIQPQLRGVEYGVDIVGDLDGGGTVRAVLARRKLGMRNGETSAAETVAPIPFRALSEGIAGMVRPRGLIDVDVIDTEQGRFVIDINPRFGGGYPFCHVAGANVPAFYLASVAQISPAPGWDDYTVGHRSSKHEGIVSFGSPGQER